MKRILSGGLVFLCFFWCVDLVFGSAINSLTIGKRQAVSSPANVVYRGTISWLRISSVDGTAFIDNAGATVPTYANGNHQISIFDSSGRELRGVLKAAGTSEGLGSELLDAWINSGSLPFETFTVSGSDITRAENTTTIGLCLKPISLPDGKLYKIVNGNYTLNSGTAPAFSLASISTAPLVILTKGSTNYATGTTNVDRLQLYVNSPSDFAFTNTSLKQVLTPSSSGATIVSTKGGTTQNFTQKNSSFTYNASSYYVIVRKMP